MKHQVALLAFGLTFLCCVAVSQDKVYAPLPDKIATAKTVFIVNDSGTAKFGDELYRQIKNWNRWQVVTDKEKADLILVLSQQESVAGYVSSASATVAGPTVSGTGVAVPVKTQRWFLHVINASSGEKLWTVDASMGGKLWRSWGSIAKSLVGDIQKRLQ